MGAKGTLSPAQHRALAALLTERTTRTAAERAGVPIRTLYKWLGGDDAFRAALAASEAQLLDTAMRRLLALQADALDALQVVLTSEDTPPAVKVSAAGRVLDALLKLRELRSVEERLAALEAQVSRGRTADPAITVDWGEP